jgi:hypothetical protein
MMADDDAVAWAHGFEAVIGRIAPRFGRKELRRRALIGAKNLACVAEASRIQPWDDSRFAADRRLEPYHRALRWTRGTGGRGA